jgi:hypothetical protein
MRIDQSRNRIYSHCVDDSCDPIGVNVFARPYCTDATISDGNRVATRNWFGDIACDDSPTVDDQRGAIWAAHAVSAIVVGEVAVVSWAPTMIVLANIVVGIRERESAWPNALRIESS